MNDERPTGKESPQRSSWAPRGKGPRRASYRGGITPLKSSLLSVLTAFQERSRRGGNQPASPSGEATPGVSVRETLLMGHILYHWKTIVGPDLGRHAYPERLFRGRLYLRCSDSSWLQTLTFLKTQILAKIRELLPEIGLTTVIGRLGEIPPERRNLTGRDWSPWQEEADSPVPALESSSLAETLQRCRKKLQARLKNMSREGYRLCETCHGVLILPRSPRSVESTDAGRGTPSPAEGPSGLVCAVCQNAERRQKMSRLRLLIGEVPWLSLEEVQQHYPETTAVEVDAVKEDLLLDSLSRVKALAESLQVAEDPVVREAMRMEMIRSVILKTGVLPFQVDLDHPDRSDLLEPEWQAWLAGPAEEEPC